MKYFRICRKYDDFLQKGHNSSGQFLTWYSLCQAEVGQFDGDTIHALRRSRLVCQEKIFWLEILRTTEKNENLRGFRIPGCVERNLNKKKKAVNVCVLRKGSSENER